MQPEEVLLSFMFAYEGLFAYKHCRRRSVAQSNADRDFNVSPPMQSRPSTLRGGALNGLIETQVTFDAGTSRSEFTASGETGLIR